MPVVEGREGRVEDESEVEEFNAPVEEESCLPFNGGVGPELSIGPVIAALATEELTLRLEAPPWGFLTS